MKKKIVVGAGYLLLSLSLVACATNTASRQERAEASRNLGEAYLHEGNYTAALKEFKKAEGLNPQDHYLQNDLGLAYHNKQQYDLAIGHFKRALALKHDYAPARNNLGISYLAIKDWDKAIYHFKEASEDLLYATPQYPLSNLGLAFYNKKEYSLSEKYFLEALAIAPDFVNALVGVAETYLAMGRVSDAVAKLEKATAVAPQSAGVHFAMAKAYRLSKDYHRAYSAYSKVIELAPNSLLADEAYKEAEKLKPMF
ncbi:MAG: tetratricopeptide repeat protein [Desulfobacterales bacterium]|nr:MAG: tetratricopeptide repeat protein [Desulfobacterales bacterium]